MAGWNVEVEVYKVYFGGEVVKEVEDEITSADVLAAAREVGIRGKFSVFDAATMQELYPEDFPYKGDVIIKRKNLAA